MNQAYPYGEVVNRYEDSALILSESIYLPETIIHQHSHRYAYFCILLRGTYTERCGSHERECKRSTVVFHPPDESHSTRFLQEGGRLFRFELKPELFNRIRGCSSVLSEPAEFEGGPPAQLASKLYREFREPDEVSKLVIEGLALELTAEVIRGRAKGNIRVPPSWLTQVCDFIHAQFADCLSLAVIAKPVGIHPLHLAHVFRQFHNCTVGEYVRRVRVDFAASQLSSSDTPLAEVAIAAGFCDQSHFSKTFKVLTGMTPAQYRSTFRPTQPGTTKLA